MTEQKQQEQGQDRAGTVRRRVGGIAFTGGFVGTLAVFGFLPGLPHVIDWGAVLVALCVGGLVRWGCLAWLVRRRR